MPYAFKDDKSKMAIPNNGNGNWVDAVYPVGSVYLSANVGDHLHNVPNPGDLFGGTWEMLPPTYYLMSADSNYNSPYKAHQQGGSDEIEYTPTGTVGNHTLTVNEMPSHTHSYTDEGASYSTTLQHVDQSTPNREVMTKNNSSTKSTVATGGGRPHSHAFTGTSATLANQPKYFTVNVWIRTA